jgi:hypothetical protein
MILGVSCLYEVALTVLDYQMKTMGVARFRAAALAAEISSAGVRCALIIHATVTTARSVCILDTLATATCVSLSMFASVGLVYHCMWPLL